MFFFWAGGYNIVGCFWVSSQGMAHVLGSLEAEHDDPGDAAGALPRRGDGGPGGGDSCGAQSRPKHRARGPPVVLGGLLFK